MYRTRHFVLVILGLLWASGATGRTAVPRHAPLDGTRMPSQAWGAARSTQRALKATMASWSWANRGAMGCFTPDQRVLFGGGLMTVEAALQTQQSTVVVLAAASTVAQPVFEEATITQFYSHLFQGGIVRIETYDGHCLRVTKSHTVLTAEGELIAADQVQPEMALMGDIGPTRVRQTWQSPYEGVVWHIAAANATGAPAILVSEQLLTGSLHTQLRPNAMEHDET